MNADILSRVMRIAANVKAVVVTGEQMGKVRNFFNAKGSFPPVVRAAGWVTLAGALLSAGAGCAMGSSASAYHALSAKSSPSAAPKDPIYGPNALDYPAFAGELDEVNRLLATGTAHEDTPALSPGMHP